MFFRVCAECLYKGFCGAPKVKTLIIVYSDRELYRTLSHDIVIYIYVELGYIVMLRARMFCSLIPVLMIKERNIRARNITI